MSNYMFRSINYYISWRTK